MGINWAEHSLEIAAPMETCFDAIVDYESFPRWQSAVSSIEVLSEKEGLGERVRLHISAKGQRIDYTLDYSYERPTTITWDFVEGHGVDDVDGVYTFEELGEGRTRATYRLGIDPSLPIPGIVARRIHSQALKRSVEELRDEAERRHAEDAARPKHGLRFGREPEPTVEQPVEAEPAPPEPEPREPEAAEPEPREPEVPEPEPGEPEPREPEPREPEPAVEQPAETAEPEPALGAATSIPKTAAEGASSLGRDAAEDGIRIARGAARTGIGVVGGAAALALGVTRAAAGTAIGLGRDVAGAVTDRVSRRVGGGGEGPDDEDQSELP
jgi:uncharacterized membrane protein